MLLTKIKTDIRSSFHVCVNFSYLYQKSTCPPDIQKQFPELVFSWELFFNLGDAEWNQSSHHSPSVIRIQSTSKRKGKFIWHHHWAFIMFVHCQSPSCKVLYEFRWFRLHVITKRHKTLIKTIIFIYSAAPN